MSRLTALSRTIHAGKYWQRYSSYNFARSFTILELVAAELPKAIFSFPIALLHQENKFIPVAVLGIESGNNLFIDQAGHWLGDYVPAILRGYPFRLLQHEDNWTLYVEEESGLITGHPPGELLFDQAGELNAQMQPVIDLLRQFEQNRLATRTICNLLGQYKLIQPWPIILGGENGERRIEGLLRIDEDRLKQLTGEALQKLHDNSGLVFAYCQLLSIQQLSKLSKLAIIQNKSKNTPVKPAPALFHQAEEDLFEFDWDGIVKQ